MKILIIKNDKKIRIHHNPIEVIVHPKSKRVEIFSTNGIILEEFDLINSKLSWLENDDDCSEIILELEVK